MGSSADTERLFGFEPHELKANEYDSFLSSSETSLENGYNIGFMDTFQGKNQRNRLERKNPRTSLKNGYKAGVMLFDNFSAKTERNRLETSFKNKCDFISDSFHDKNQQIPTNEVNGYCKSVDSTLNASDGSASDSLSEVLQSAIKFGFGEGSALRDATCDDQQGSSLADFFFGGTQSNEKLFDERINFDASKNVTNSEAVFSESPDDFIDNSNVSDGLLNSKRQVEDHEIVARKSHDTCMFSNGYKQNHGNEVNGECEMLETDFHFPLTESIDNASDNSLSKMLQSVTLDFGEGSLLNDLASDDQGMSLADLFFGGSKQPQVIEDVSNNSGENSFEKLIADLSHNDSNVKFVPSATLDSFLNGSILNSANIELYDLNSKPHQDKDDHEVPFIEICESSESLNFSLADLYYNEKSELRTELCESCLESCDDVDGPVSLVAKDVDMSDSENYCDDDDVGDNYNESVDLCSAVKRIFSEDSRLLHCPGFGKYSLKKSELLKSKPSLFCRVLCTKPKIKDVSSVPKYPSNLYELVGEINNVEECFSFDSLSPDDIVKEKQKHAYI